MIGRAIFRLSLLGNAVSGLILSQRICANLGEAGHRRPQGPEVLTRSQSLRRRTPVGRRPCGRGKRTAFESKGNFRFAKSTPQRGGVEPWGWDLPVVAYRPPAWMDMPFGQGKRTAFESKGNFRFAKSTPQRGGVEPWGFEPQTSSMPLRRSTN